MRMRTRWWGRRGEWWMETMEICGVVWIVVMVLCVQVLSGAAVGGDSGDECGGVEEFLRREFQLRNVSSHGYGGEVGRRSSGRGGDNAAAASSDLCAPPPNTPTDNNNSSSSNPSSSSSRVCCGSSMVDDFVKSSNVLLSTFNNTDQYNRFKEKITSYESTISSHAVESSSNLELWNATIHGLGVLRSWGVKYWDPVYLHRNNVFSSYCINRVVQGNVCGGCTSGGKLPIVKPCKSLCHNLVVGCIKSPLANFIESPWKHAVNSVRTAIRLVITTGGDAKQNTQALQDLVADLNDWREPITWWLPDYKRSASCESLPTSGCWNGETVGRYEFGTVTWKSNFNPEFSNVYRGDIGDIHPDVIVELDRFRNELVGVRKTLEKYWPTTSSPSSSSHHHQQQQHHKSPSPPHALPLSSSESASPPHSSYIHDIVDTGSGDDSFESDDEDLEYINSGYGPHIQDSDDEDFNGYGSGEGSGDDADTDLHPNSSGGNDDFSKVTDGDAPPIGLSGSPRIQFSFVMLLLCSSLWLYNY